MKKLLVSVGFAIAILGTAGLSQATLLSFNNGTFSFSDDASTDFSFSWDNTTSSGYYSSLRDLLNQWSESLNSDGGYPIYSGAAYRSNQFNFNTSDEYRNGEGTAPVPEPATMLLFGSGLIGLASLGLRRKNKK